MEQRLFGHLKAAGIAFMRESELMRLGYPKTPDALLTIPIAINGMIVNWIESKAFFGSISQHDMYLQKQYWAYHNRYHFFLLFPKRLVHQAAAL